MSSFIFSTPSPLQGVICKAADVACVRTLSHSQRRSVLVLHRLQQVVYAVQLLLHAVVYLYYLAHTILVFDGFLFDSAMRPLIILDLGSTTGITAIFQYWLISCSRERPDIVNLFFA